MLIYKKNDQSLILIGELNQDTLPIFWQKRKQLLTGINSINLAKIFYIDSAGIAMLVRLKLEFKYLYLDNKLLLSGISNQFTTLIRLYKLEEFIK